MPSKKKDRGSPVFSVRVPQELLNQIDQIMKESEQTRFAGPWTRNEWIISAIKEKIGHRERSRKSSKKRKMPPPATTPADEPVHQLAHLGELAASLSIPTEVQL